MVSDELGIGHDPGRHAAYVKRWVQVIKEDPKEILCASRDADKITGHVIDLEKERAPANIEKLPQIERPAAQPIAQKALAEEKRTLTRRSASDRER